MRLTVEAFEAREADDADAGVAFGGFDGPLDFGAGGEDDSGEGCGFLHEDVAALERALAAGGGAGEAEEREILTAEREQRGAVSAAEGRGEGGSGFFGVGRADDVEVRNDAEAADGFDGLVSGAVFTDADAVVREDVGDRQFCQGGEPDARAAVVGEDEESRAAG